MYSFWQIRKYALGRFAICANYNNIWKKLNGKKKTGRKLAQENILLQYYVAVEVDFPERGF